MKLLLQPLSALTVRSAVLLLIFCPQYYNAFLRSEKDHQLHNQHTRGPEDDNIHRDNSERVPWLHWPQFGMDENKESRNADAVSAT